MSNTKLGTVMAQLGFGVSKVLWLTIVKLFISIDLVSRTNDRKNNLHLKIESMNIFLASAAQIGSTTSLCARTPSTIKKDTSRPPFLHSVPYFLLIYQRNATRTARLPRRFSLRRNGICMRTSAAALRN